MKVSHLFLWLLLAVGVFLAESIPAAEQLLVAREVDDRCDVSLWNSRSGVAQRLESFEHCPDRLFISEARASVFYLVDTTIFQISIQDAAAPKAIAKVPDLTFETIAKEALSRPLTKYENMTASSIMKIRNAGVSDDGVLWIHAGQVMAGDDDYDFLIKLIDGKWVVDEFIHCGRFEACEFAAFAEKDSSDTKTVLAPEIWDDMIKANPFFVRDEHTPGDATNYWASKIDRHFEIEGQPVILEVWTKSGPDTGFTYTAGAVLRHDDGDSLIICEGQCWAALTGQFLLARRFWGGTLELYDIATGESVFGPLISATWANFPKTMEPLQ